MTLPDRDVMKHHSVKLWLHGAGLSVNHILAISNYYQAQRTVYRELGQYGIAPKLIEEDDNEFICCHNVPVGSYLVDINGKGKVFRFMRELEMSVENMVDEFGYDRCSHLVKQDYDRGEYGRLVRLIKVIEPNRLFQERGLIGLKGMPFASITYEADVDATWNTLLKVSGYYEWPLPCPRWDKLNGDIYGYGPCLETLGDVKALQALEANKARAIDKQVTPPTQGPAGLVTKRLNHMPAAHTSVPGMGENAAIRTLYEVRPDMISLTNEIARHEQRISRALFSDLLNRVSNIDEHNVKAAQIQGIEQERMMTFSPVLERLYDELLDIDIQRVFAIAFRRGYIPPPPPEMSDMNLQVQYTGPYAQLQKAIGVGAIERTVAMAGQLSATYPQVADKVNPDKVMDEYAEALGPPPGIMFGDAEVEQIRRSREQQQAAAKTTEEVAMGLEAAKTASETKLTDPSMLSYLIGGSS
jgi:hypothetical protein